MKNETGGARFKNMRGQKFIQGFEWKNRMIGRLEDLCVDGKTIFK
jgi:hypothetical protein